MCSDTDATINIMNICKHKHRATAGFIGRWWTSSIITDSNTQKAESQLYNGNDCEQLEYYPHKQTAAL